MCIRFSDMFPYHDRIAKAKQRVAARLFWRHTRCQVIFNAHFEVRPDARAVNPLTWLRAHR